MTRVLLVDDNEIFRSVIGIALLKEGFEVTTAKDGEAAILQARQAPPDLVLLNSMMPKLDGFGACRRIRVFSDAPILICSVKRAEDDKIMALEFGADAYITKPFGHRELIARIRALLRRSQPDREREEPDATIGPIRLDPKTRTAYLGETNVRITPTEHKIPRVLIGHPDRVFSPEHLLRQVHDYVYTRGEVLEILKVNIRRLRQKIERNADRPLWIQNVRGNVYVYHPYSHTLVRSRSEVRV